MLPTLKIWHEALYFVTTTLTTGNLLFTLPTSCHFVQPFLFFMHEPFVFP